MNLMRTESSLGGASKLCLGNLPPAMLQKAASRLSWVALVCAGVAMVMPLVQHALQPEVAQTYKQLSVQINTAAVILLSLIIAVAGLSGRLSATAVLQMGLVYEVLVGFAITTFDYAMPWDPTQPVRGVSWTALWLALCGLLIPNRPLIMATVMLITASMGPLAYLIFSSPIPINRLLIWNLPNYLVGFSTVLISRRLYHLETKVHQAKEMGSYQLESLIGKGGMGEVWRARHRMLARDSAIKLIRPEMLVSVTGKDVALIRRRFEQEAKVTAALRSPHTVELYDFGVSEDGGFYYVMELLDGIDLETLVKRFGPQHPGRVVGLLIQVCQSLAEAHRAGLVHRDIKPTNIFLCRMGVQYDFAKVLDFGLVKTVLGEGETRMTREGVTTGTPAYIAPEVAIASEQIDGRADLYGLGCVAYWLLTGNLVFGERSAMAMVMAHVQETPVPPSQKSELSIPASLDRVVMACLAKEPKDRPTTSEALARMLDECRDTGHWTQEDAESWWRTNRPEAFAKRAHAPQPGGSASAAATFTL